MTETLPRIPTEVRSFEVRCKIGQFVMDGSDQDRAPDLAAIGGKVTIAPDLRKPVRINGEDPLDTRVVGVNGLEFQIEAATGRLLHPDGQPGVELVDPSDPHLDPQGWTYTATVTPAVGRAWSVTFGAPPDGATIVNIGGLAGVEISPGAGANPVQQVVSARDETRALVTTAADAATTAASHATAAGESATYAATIAYGQPLEVTDATVASIATAVDTTTGKALQARFGHAASVIVRIPANYPTLQAAVDAYASRNVVNGAKIELRITAGHRVTSGIAVSDGDYSHFRITSDDPVAQVADTFTGDFIRATNARAPRLATLVDMRDRGEDGYALWRNSVGYVDQYCGIQNAGQRGLYATDNCTCFALRSVFKGSGNRNVWITRASVLDAELSDFSANKGGENAVYISRASRANIQSCNITDAYQNAVTVTRSEATLNTCDLSNAGLRGIVTDSVVYARDCTIKNTAGNGISADQAASVTLRDSVVQGCGASGVLSAGSSVVELSGTSVTGSVGPDLTVIRAGVVNAFNARTSASTGPSPVLGNTNVATFNTPSSIGAIWA